MKKYEEKLKNYIKENKIKAEQIFFKNLVDHKENVLKIIDEKDINFNDIIKTVVFIDLEKEIKEGNGVIGIVPANSRVSKEKLKKISKARIKIASPEQVLILTTYPAGGVPPFGFKGKFYLDKILTNKEIVYAGGGSVRTLIRTTIKEIVNANKCNIADIVEYVQV